MIDLPANYARVLLERNIDSEAVNTSRKLLTELSELYDALINPLVRKSEKHSVIEALFPQPMWSFMKVMSDNGDIPCSTEMFDAYDAMVRKQQDTVKAVFTYVTKPDDAQIEQLKQKIAKDFHKKNVALQCIEDPSLIGGFVLTVGDFIFDQSVKTSMRKLKRHFTGK